MVFRSRCGPNSGRLRCGCGNPLDRVWQQHLHNSHPTPAALNSCDGVNRGLVVKQLPAVTVSLQILSSSCQLLQQRVQAVVTVIRGEPFGSRCFCGGLWPDTGAATTNSFKKLSKYIWYFYPTWNLKKHSYKRNQGFFYVFFTLIFWQKQAWKKIKVASTYASYRKMFKNLYIVWLKRGEKGHELVTACVNWYPAVACGCWRQVPVASSHHG